MLKDSTKIPDKSEINQDNTMVDMIYMSQKWAKLLNNPNCTRVLLELIRTETDQETIVEAIHLYMHYRNIKEENLDTWIKEKLVENKGK